MRIGCIIQARLNSDRFPRKVLEDIGGWPMIRHVQERMLTLGIPVIVAFPEEDAGDKALPRFAEFFEGPTEDVLGRYLKAAQKHSLDGIVRVTGDCPLIDPEACAHVIRVFEHGLFDYVANDWHQFGRYPDGMGCEVFTRTALEDANQYAKDGPVREHVTGWIKLQCEAGKTNYYGRPVICPRDLRSGEKFSVDTPEDLERVRMIDARLPGGSLKYMLSTTLQVWGNILKTASDKI